MTGVDMRVPLADRRLVELCLAIPEEQQRRSGESRMVARRALAGRLPPETLASGQRGLQAAGWFETLSAERESLIAETERIAQDQLASAVLDVPRLRRTLELWADRRPTGGEEVELLGVQLPLALVCGRFVLWAHGPGSRPDRPASHG